ncbi:MAG: flagellar hook-associated protein FlgK [Firmicutes bacterium]|nr:flagellar hook-associated protein FlgK [Bacillota bacterium]
MPGTFFGIETAKRALWATQTALDTTGHNISNANTPGYSRQVANLVATEPYAMPGFTRTGEPQQLGTGVMVASVDRMRDVFLDWQLRQETQTKGYWQSMNTGLNQVELILDEPSESGLRGVLDEFWSALQDLSKQPESLAVRAVVREKAQTLTELFHANYKQLDDLYNSLGNDITKKVDQLNSLAGRIADLNARIIQVESTGGKANDLKDQRDYLIGQAAQIVNLRVVEQNNGSVDVLVGGGPLVEGKVAHNLVAQVTGSSSDVGGVQFHWLSDGGPTAEITNGELAGLRDMREAIRAHDGKSGWLDRLNALAADLVTKFNDQHYKGYDLNGQPGTDFFAPPTPGNPVTAENIRLSDQITNDLGNIAASASAGGAPGDGDNAIALGEALDATRTDYRSLISSLGVDAQHAKNMEDNQTALVSQLDRLSQSVSGVSLDEEMTNMIRFQQGYNAAARLVTTLDEMLDTMISRMGLVGR